MTTATQEAESRSTYNQEYYRKNKDRISARRKKKYHSDGQHRSRLQRLARDRYNQVAKSRDKAVGYTVKKIDGMELYTITYAAQVTGRPKETLRTWEKRGYIPLTTYTDTRGWRLYTAHQIKLLQESFQRFDAREWTVQDVQNYLFERWENG